MLEEHRQWVIDGVLLLYIHKMSTIDDEEDVVNSRAEFYNSMVRVVRVYNSRFTAIFGKFFTFYDFRYFGS